MGRGPDVISAEALQGTTGPSSFKKHTSQLAHVAMVSGHKVVFRDRTPPQITR